MPQTQTVNDPPFIAGLRAIVGQAQVFDGALDMAGYLTDWTGQYRADALAVVRPSSTAEVADVVRHCIKHGIAIVPQGGRTGLCGGGVPQGAQPSVVLSLTRMNKTRAIDVAGRTVVAEAGVVLETLHAETLLHQLVFPLTFGAKGSCTLGGALSTNAGGSNVVRYGTTRELCVGIEAVMPDGSIINALTGLRKDNTGYDLKDLMIGAEGTLGIITAAVFKLFPEPVTRATAFLSVASLEAAIEVLNRLQDQTGGAVEAFEYMPRAAVDLICKVFPAQRQPLETPARCGIFVEVASVRPLDAERNSEGDVRLEADVLALLAGLMDDGLVLDAVIAQSQQQRADLWTLRESILEAITEAGPAYHLDIALPLAQIAPFVAQMDVTAAQAGFQPVTVGHLGDGNLHYALTAAAGQNWESLPLERVRNAAFDLLADLNGSFSAEHGIGQSKLAVMTHLKEPSQLAVMRTLKRALDPQNLMNPGKLIPAV